MEPQIHHSISEPKSVNVELLGKPIHIVRDKLEAIIQDSSHYLANELQSSLNTTKIDVVFDQVTVHTLATTDMEKAQTSVYRHQHTGFAYIFCDTPLLIKLADRFYNTDIERKSPTLTSSDLRLQERMAHTIIDWIAPRKMWQSHEYEFSHGVGLKAQLTLNYTDQKGQAHSGTLTLMFEHQLVQTLINELELNPDKDLHDPFCQALEAVPVRLNVLLSKTTLPLSDVLTLAPNDILPIELLNAAPASIGNERLFTGRVADQEGQLVLILNDDKESQR